MLLKVKDGWKIKLETGKVFPKVYTSKGEAVRRIQQLRRHSKKDE